jgi:hypothetical protein
MRNRLGFGSRRPWSIWSHYGRTEGNHKRNLSVRTAAGIQAQIRSGCLPNTNPERYRFTRSLGCIKITDNSPKLVHQAGQVNYLPRNCCSIAAANRLLAGCRVLPSRSGTTLSSTAPSTQFLLACFNEYWLNLTSPLLETAAYDNAFVRSLYLK